MKVTSEKNCFCHTCNKEFHYLGINSHRALHRRRHQDCRITYTHGDTYVFKFSKDVANECYNIADAMLAEREKEVKP